jgi:hypothetical protein
MGFAKVLHVTVYIMSFETQAIISYISQMVRMSRTSAAVRPAADVGAE